MSYKSRKRRDQRLRRIKRIQLWKDHKRFMADEAFKEWKEIHVPKLIEELRRTIPT